MITITITPQSVINDSNQPLLSVMSDDQSVLPNPHPLSTDDANNSNQLVLTMGEIIFFVKDDQLLNQLVFTTVRNVQTDH